MLKVMKEQELTCTSEKGMTSWDSAQWWEPDKVGYGTEGYFSELMTPEPDRPTLTRQPELKQWEMVLVYDE